MLVKDLVLKINAEILNEGDSFESSVEGCYIGDLLSWVMSKAKEGDAWITIMSNVNVAAVATLTDVSCVILCENVEPDSECLNRVKQQGITMLKTSLTAYETALSIGNI